jgi:DNA-binding transcriptional ArsR family regulator
MSNDNKTTTVLNKDNEVVYQETLVSECIKESNNQIQINDISPSTDKEEDISSSSQPEKYTRWTQEEIELLKQLTLQNVPPREIEKNPNINKSRNAIRNKLHELRTNKEIPSSSLRIDGWTPEDDEMIISSLNDNEDDKAISVKLNKSLSAVTHHIRRLRAAGKISLPDRRTQNSVWLGREDDVETLKRLIKEGYRVKDMLSHLSHEYTYAQVASKVTVLKKLKNSKI